MNNIWIVGITASALLWVGPLAAQEEATAVTQPAGSVAEPAAVMGPAGDLTPTDSAPAFARVFSEAEIAAIERPRTSFVEDDEIAENFDKYFYFHREGVNFDAAYADITECDQLASGFAVYEGPDAGFIPATLAGGVGGAIGNVLGNLIFGSAANRSVRRINMRNCMGFKGYERYGLPKDLWQEFHFEEGNGRKRDDVREAALLQQARVASGSPPAERALGI